jgi:hypothetical protein
VGIVLRGDATGAVDEQGGHGIVFMGNESNVSKTSLTNFRGV